jgi:hypothetical protein
MFTYTTPAGATVTCESLDALKAAMALLEPKADQPTVADQPKADGKVYRSAKGKAQAKADVEAVWAKAKAQAKVKRVKDLSAKQRAEVDAQVKAIWAAVPKTRTTKA